MLEGLLPEVPDGLLQLVQGRGGGEVHVDLLCHLADVEEGGGGSVGDDLDGLRVRQRLVMGRLRGLHVHVGGEEDGLGLRHAVGRDVDDVEPGDQVVV